ncbi:sporulation protein YqfD [Metabacillus arenae]|uniref:Sporulation protein YqfD n=1 Tax=Metabacillus arenae TaxID=2771434 RepID=A0A926NI48_9BACI|nr:sporulation protein YqfD [Metabacillus arenae]MBD1382104.1 sporulation protein YqfD [Metabacillus arenae]
MKNFWTNYFQGVIKVTIKGAGTERFLNDCSRNQIVVWNVRKDNNQAISFFIRFKDVQAIRHIVRKNECKCYFQKRIGLPFLYKKSLRNSGFIIGLGIFLFSILLLSNMVWGIEIKGATPQTEHLIKKELDRIGVKIGKIQFFVEKPDIIQKKLTDGIDEITWVGVELTGTTYHLNVVEKTSPNKEKLFSPQHIVAKKKAVISKMFVEEGKPMVMVNEHVKKGQILVSGLIGSEKNQKKVPARGEIFGETWYKSTVTVPLNTGFQVYSGKDNRKHYIRLGSLQIPIWGFNQEKLDSFELEEDTRYVKFLNWSLPIAYVKEIFRENEEITRSYSVDQAIDKGIEMGKIDVKQKIGEDGEIISQKVLHHSKENGKVKLEILYKTNENIVKTTPIVQGD